MKSYLRKTLTSYAQIFGITSSLEAFELFMNSFDNLSSRKNLAGHITGSALILHEATHSVLRVYNRKLNCWVFSAGGHIEESEMPWLAATRELTEETGIIAQPTFTSHDPLPLLMDAHPIPANSLKSEPAHWHYDMLYLYTVKSIPVVRADPYEISDTQWCDISSVTKDNSPVNLAPQLQKYISK